MVVVPLLAEIPQVPLEQVGSFLLCLILFTYFANQVKKLFGWDKPLNETGATKGEVESVKEGLASLSARLSAQVALCATKEEVSRLGREINDKYDKLEKYSHDQAHDTINAVNALQLNVERVRVEMVRETTQAIQRSEDRLTNRINELFSDRLGHERVQKRGGQC